MIHDDGSARPPALRFLARYVERILLGTKTQTLRRDTRLRVGAVALAQLGPRPFARVLITHVERIRLAELDEADLARQGGSPKSVAALHRALRSLYGAKLTHVYRIRFRVIGRTRRKRV